MTFRLGPATVDLDSATVRVGADLRPLSPLEVKLLRHLAAQPGRVVPRQELLVDVWGYRPQVRTRTVDNAVCRLREKIERDPSNPEHLLAVYGQGLKLVGLTTESDAGPTPGGPFVGRRDALASIGEAFGAGARLVTVCGPPGAGKTRLARQYALGCRRQVAIADLSSARSDVDAAVAAALGVAGAGDPVQLVPEVLASRGALLLVLDECEHADTSVAERVVAWTARAPQLQIVATSRRPLPAAGGVRVLLGSLDPGDAAELFVARARWVDPSFLADADDLERLVRALDGLPLALELAAARIGVLSVRELIATVERQLDVLGSPDRGLRAALEGALGLLPPAPRELLRAVASFEAPFTLTDAQQIAGLGVGPALDGIQLLVDHGLLRVVPTTDTGAAETRYAPYAFVRERMREALGPDDPVWQRHARRLAQLGTREHLEACAVRPELRAALRLASADLVAALDRAAAPDEALRCGLALLWRYGREGPLASGLSLVPRLEPLPTTDADRVRLVALVGLLYKFAGDYRRGLELTAPVMELDGDPADRVTLHTLRCVFHGQVGQPDEAVAELDRAAPLVPGSRLAAAPYLQQRAQNQGSVPVAEELLLEAARIASELGDVAVEAASHSILAHVLMTYGQWMKSASHFERALERFGDDPGSTRSRSVALTFSGMLAARQGDLARAGALLEQAERLQRMIGNRETLELTRVERAQLETAHGRPERAIAALMPLVAEIRNRPNWNAAIAHLALAEAEFFAGRPGRARQAAEHALEHARLGQYRATTAAALDVLALVEANANRPERARELLRESAEIGSHSVPLRVRLAAVVTIVEALAGNPDAAEHLRAAYALAEQLQMSDDALEMPWVRLAEDVLRRPPGEVGLVRA